MGWNEQLRAQHQNNNCQDSLVLRSAPHVLRRGRYVDMLLAHTLHVAHLTHYSLVLPAAVKPEVLMLQAVPGVQPFVFSSTQHKSTSCRRHRYCNTRLRDVLYNAPSSCTANKAEAADCCSGPYGSPQQSASSETLPPHQRSRYVA